MLKKKVRFNDNIEVRSLGVSLREHIQEIKNPPNMIKIIGSIPTSPIIEVKSDMLFGVKWWWVIGIIILCLIIYGVWSYFSNSKQSGKNAKKNIAE